MNNFKTLLRYTPYRRRVSFEECISGSLSDGGITPAQVTEYGVLCNNNTGTETEGCYPTVQAAITGTTEMHPNYLANGSFSWDDAGTVDPSEWTVVGLTSTDCCGNCTTGSDGVVCEGYRSGYQSYKLDNTSVSGTKRIDLTRKNADKVE